MTPSWTASAWPMMTLTGVRNSWAISAVIWRRNSVERTNSAFIRLNEAASSPSSSRLRTGTSCFNWPAETAWVAAVNSRIGRVRVRESRKASSKPTAMTPMALNVYNLHHTIQESRLSRVHVNGRLPGHHGPDDFPIYFYGDAILNVRLWQQVANMIARSLQAQHDCCHPPGKRTARLLKTSAAEKPVREPAGQHPHHSRFRFYYNNLPMQ